MQERIKLAKGERMTTGIKASMPSGVLMPAAGVQILSVSQAALTIIIQETSGLSSPKVQAPVLGMARRKIQISQTTGSVIEEASRVAICQTDSERLITYKYSRHV